MHSNNKRLSDAQIVQILRPYYSAPVTADFCDQVRAYIALLLRWNERVSLTTVTDPLQILRFHFGESLFVIDQVPIRHGRLADVGSGAGFPAVPVRMALNGIRVTLVESNRKKCAFLSEVARELALTNFEVHPGRMEDLKDCRAQFDFVTARAIAIDDAFLNWSSGSLQSEGTMALWLGHDDSVRVSRSHTFDWRPAVRIPDSERRFLLIGNNSLQHSRRST